jgi:glutaminase
MNDKKIYEIFQNIYDLVKPIKDGKVADYIPQLQKVNPEDFGFSVCSVSDGSITSYGDTTVNFCLQSCSKPLTYCIAHELYGLEKIHKSVGFEPSGQTFNAHTLNNEGKPHNPMINAGAIIVASMIEPDKEPADRFDIVHNYYSRMAGNKIKETNFNNSVYLSEQQHADRNISLAYYMRENGAFLKRLITVSS